MKKVFVTIVSVVAAQATQDGPFDMWGYHESTAAPAAPQGSDKPHVNVGGRFQHFLVKRERPYNDGASNVPYKQAHAKQRASEKKYSGPVEEVKGRQVPDEAFA